MRAIKSMRFIKQLILQHQKKVYEEMPIYEYKCSACGQEVDVLQKMSDATIRLCKKCMKGVMERRISAPNFHLKGTGWYETDFKRKR